MTEIAELHDIRIQRAARRPALTTDQLFRLWKAAVKDDDKLADQMLQKIYDDMIAFDHERAKELIELTVQRNPAASHALREFLRETRAC